MVMLGCFLAHSPMVFRSFDRDGEGTARHHLVSQAQLHLMAGLPIAFLLGVGGPVVSRIAFGPEFRPAAEQLIPWFAAAAFLQGLQAFYVSYLFTIHRRTLWNASICAGAALVNLALNFLLVPVIGLVGAALATVVSYGLVIAASLVVAGRWMTLPWPVRDMLKVVGACALAAPLAIAARMSESLPLAVLGLGMALVVIVAAIVLLDAAGMRGRVAGAIRQWRVPQPDGAAEVKTPVP